MTLRNADLAGILRGVLVACLVQCHFIRQRRQNGVRVSAVRLAWLEIGLSVFSAFGISAAGSPGFRRLVDVLVVAIFFSFLFATFVLVLALARDKSLLTGEPRVGVLSRIARRVLAYRRTT